MLLFIMADHGMRYGDWFKLLDGSHEHKLPSLFIIGSNSLLDDIPFSYDILNHNSYRLTSKLDLNKTLRHITLLPYNQNLSKYHFPGFNDNIVSLF